MSATKNYIVGDKHIERTNGDIIDAYYAHVKIPKKMVDKSIKMIEVNPLYGGRFFKINYTYDVEADDADEIERKGTQLCAKKCISIDLGMCNLMTIYDPSGYQTIIKGNHVISINGYYNSKIDVVASLISQEKNEEKKEELKMMRYRLEIKRKNKIDDHFNKIVKYLYVRFNETKEKIIMGYNLGWKNGINLRGQTNRKFYSIPYSRLIGKLRDKFGKKRMITEESYTSKCDSLGLEEIGKKDKYGGKRIKRGLYKSSKGLINADMNGAINIMRKVIDLKKIEGDGIYNPVVVKIRTPTDIKLSRDVRNDQRV